MNKKILFLIVVLMSNNVNADPLNNVGLKAANQVMSKCDRNWIPGDCIFKVWSAYKIAKTAMSIKKFELNRSKRIKKGTFRTIKRFTRLTPQGRVINKINKIGKMLK